MNNLIPTDIRIIELQFEHGKDKNFYCFNCIDTMNHMHRLFGNNDNEQKKFRIGNYKDVDSISRILIEAYINGRAVALGLIQ